MCITVYSQCTLQYILKGSNRPPNIIKKILITIERTSHRSSNKTVFPHPAEDYEKALKRSGCNVKLQYKPANHNTNDKTNRRKILFGSIQFLVKKYIQKLVITFLIFQISTFQKIIIFTVFSIFYSTSKLAIAAPET